MRILPIIAFIGFVGIIDTAMLSPILASYAVSLNAPRGVAAIIVALYSIIAIMVSFPLGYLADRIGRRKVLLMGIPGDILAFIIYLLAPNYTYLIIARALHAFFDSMIFPSAIAMVGDSFRKLGKPLSFFWTFTAISILIGSGLTATLVFRFGFSAVFSFIIALHVTALLLVYNLKIKEVFGYRLGNSLGVIKMNYLKLLPAFVTMFSVYLINGVVVGSLGPILSIVEKLPHEQAAARVGIFMAIATATSIPFFYISSLISERIRPELSLAFSSLAAFFTSLVFYFNVAYYLVASIILGVSLGLGFLASSYVTASMREEARGSASGILQGLSLTGIIIGSISSGLIPVQQYALIFLIPLTLSVIALIISLSANFVLRSQ